MKFLLWGTGNIAEKVWNNGLNGEMLGFIETCKRKEEYMGYPVYSINDMPKEYDFIIVANNFGKDIYNECLKRNIDIQKVIFILKEIHASFHGNPDVRQLLGEENFTNYSAEYNSWKGTFFEDDMKTYSKLNNRKEFNIDEKYLYPIISDKFVMNGDMTDYFWQDLWAARHIIRSKVKEHYDIGSRVDGFIAHLLASDIKVNVIDIRPFSGKAENLNTIVDDATMLKNFQDNSIESLSALCSLEHFGLGRYGDPIDPEACFKCFVQIQKKLKKGGKLYISIPIGQDRVEFNAHRIFYANTIISSFNKLKLVEYSVIVNKRIEYNIGIHQYDNKEPVTGLFLFEK